uniref:Helicase ATP-binding domain-containing protein n=1 Tax=Panagrolaimus davidi TaxID=227884 RepID=A0A914P306_9BILA
MSAALQQLIASFTPEQMELWRAAQPQVQADPVNTQQLDENNMQVDPVLDFSTDEKIMELVHPLLKYGKNYDPSAKHDGLKVHQIEGHCFLIRNVIGKLNNGNIVGPGAGAILAHNMGLGKSFTTIAFIHTVLSNFNNVISKVLIIAPQNVTGHWKKEFPKFLKTQNNRIAEDIRITNFEESGKTLRFNTISNWYKNTGEKHILIMSYDMFKRMANDDEFYKFLVKPGPDLVIFDESHKLKNNETQNYKCTRRISTPRKIFLTGTPLQNDPKELYQMINFLHRGLLGSENDFKSKYADPIEDGKTSDASELEKQIMRQKCRQLYQRLLKYIHRKDVQILRNEVNKDKTEVTLLIRPSEMQQTIIEKYLERIYPFTHEKPKRNSLSDRLYITYALNHPFIFNSHHHKNPDHTVDPAASVFKINSINDAFDISLSYKLILLIEIIKFCEKVGYKLIIFSQSIDTLDYIENLLQRMSQSWNNRAINCPEGEIWKWENGKDYMRIDGTTSGRQEIQEIFEETPQIRLMLMSTIASIYRTYRINQQKNVYVYRFVTKGTMEEWIYNRQVTKESIARRIVDDEDIENIFSQNELENLYKYERIPPYIPGEHIDNYFHDQLVHELIKNHPEIIAELKDHDSFFCDIDDF